MVVDLHKCSNGNKKIVKWLNIPLSTFRAIIKKFKRYGTVENLMGRGRNYLAPQDTEENGERSNKMKEKRLQIYIL